MPVAIPGDHQRPLGLGGGRVGYPVRVTASIPVLGGELVPVFHFTDARSVTEVAAGDTPVKVDPHPRLIHVLQHPEPGQPDAGMPDPELIGGALLGAVPPPHPLLLRGGERVRQVSGLIKPHLPRRRKPFQPAGGGDIRAAEPFPA